MKITATIQARMGSTRLPGKVMKLIVGKPMLALQIERIRRSMLIDEIVVATSVNSRDDPIERLAEEVGVSCFRGSEEDVLSRVVDALRTFQADVHVELTGDNPLPDPMLIDSIIGYYLKNADRYDLVTNSLTTTYPPGQEVYVYRPEVLFEAESRVTDSALREHVSIHIYQHHEQYRICNLEAPTEFHRPDLYLEVDTQEDFEVVSAIYEHFYSRNPAFSLAQVIDFMDSHPELASRNSNIERRWTSFRRD